MINNAHQAHRTATRLLIVEDNPIDVELLGHALDRVPDWATERQVAEDGEKAIILLGGLADRNFPPDLIILDINLPRRDGTEVLRFIRSTMELMGVPVLIFSTSPGDIVERKLVEAKVTADGHFEKPSSFEQFLALGPTLKDWYFKNVTRVLT